MNKRKFYLPVPAVLLLVVLWLAACNSLQAQNRPTANEASLGKAPAPAVSSDLPYQSSDGPVAPNWTLDTLAGNSFQLADHQGEVVVMYFMASWCGSCVQEAQALAKLQKQYGKQGLTVVAINVEPEKNREGLSQFRQMADNAAYTWAFDPLYTVTKLYSVHSLDSTIIIDRAGQIAYTDAFPTSLATLEAEVKKWL